MVTRRIGCQISALLGGLGTFEELFEVWTWGQLGYHRKPVALLNVGGFYDEMIRFLEGVVVQGFVRRENREMLIVAHEADELIARLRAYVPPDLPQWIGAGER